MTSLTQKLTFVVAVEQAAKAVSEFKKLQKGIDDTGKSSTSAGAKTTKAQKEQIEAEKQLAATFKQIDREIAASKETLAKAEVDSAKAITEATEKQIAAEKELDKLTSTRAAQGNKPRDVTTGRFISQQQAASELAAAQLAAQQAVTETFRASQPVRSAQNALASGALRQSNLASLTQTAPPIKPADVANMAAMAGATKQYTTALEEAEGATVATKTATQALVGSLLQVAKAAAVAFIAYKALSIIKNIISDTTELGVQTYQLQQVIGGTSKQVSGLIFGFKQFGIEPKAATTALGIFSRNLALVDENAAGLNTRGQQSTRVLAGLGIKVLQANGQLRPTIDILKDLADKFANSSDEGLKAGIAAQLFGEQGGRTLLPFLNQGSAGINKLNDDAERLGLTLDQKSTNASYKFAQSQKELNQALKGLEVQIGGAILPLLTALTDAFVNLAPQVASAINTLVGIVQDVLESKLGGIFVKFAETRIAGFVLQFVHGFRAVRDGVRAVIALFSGDVDEFGKKLVSAFGELGKAMAANLISALGTVPDAITGIIEDAINAVIHGINKIPEIKVAGHNINPVAGQNIGEVHLPRLGDISGANKAVTDVGDAIKKAGQASSDAADGADKDRLALDGVTDAEKKALEELQKLAQGFKSTSEAAGQVEDFTEKLKLFGIVSSDLAERLNLSATAAGNVQGVDAVINAQKRATEEAFNFTKAMATVAQAFQQSATVAQNIVLGIARSALEAARTAVSAVTGRPTREVADLGAQLAGARLASARVAEANNPQLRTLQDQLKTFDTGAIEKRLRELSRQADATDKFFRDLKRAADKQEKALDRQADLLGQQLDQMKRADLLAQIAYERFNANLERQIAATQKTASDLQKAFLLSNENLQRQINQRIGAGDTQGALNLVDVQRQQADAYHRQARALQNNEEQLTAQQKAAKAAEEERQRNQKLAEDEVNVRKEALDRAKKQLQVSADFTDAENAAKDALDAQKQSLEDQKQAIEDNKDAVQKQIDAIQGVIDKSKQDEQAIQDHIDVFKAETDLSSARADAARNDLQTQEQQRQSLDDLIGKIGQASQTVADLATQTGQSFFTEVDDAGKQFKTFSGALKALVDQDFQKTLIEGGIDPVAQRLDILRIAEEDATSAIRRMTQAAVTFSSSVGGTGSNTSGNRSIFDLFGHSSTSGSGRSQGLFGIGRNAAGGIYSNPTATLVGEAGSEAILPLTKPYRAREILGQLSPALLASISPRGGSGAVFAPTINVTGETLDTMEAVAHRALSTAFRDAKVQSTRASSLLGNGLGGNI